MKIVILLLAGLLLAAVTVNAQTAQQTNTPSAPPSAGTASSQSQASAPQAPNAGAPRIAPGSVIPVQLSKTVDAKKAKTGDEVVAKVTQDLQATTGQVLVQKDTKVIGHVTEAQPRNKEQKQSQLGIAFDRAVTKDGNQMQMPMSIQAVIAPPSNNNAAEASAPGEAGGGTGSSAGYPSGGTSGGARSGGGMSGSSPQPTPTPSAGTPSAGNTQSASNTRQMPQITGNTEGVIGIKDLNLSAGQNATQGSVLTSDKNNVKIEGGTFMLLRVSK